MSGIDSKIVSTYFTMLNSNPKTNLKRTLKWELQSWICVALIKIPERVKNKVDPNAAFKRFGIKALFIILESSSKYNRSWRQTFLHVSEIESWVWAAMIGLGARSLHLNSVVPCVLCCFVQLPNQFSD